ncbi:hypothetical protein [Pradoshia eiseniae]|uniref:hypothetical protein n=1 Tax=Pradoshia eiseniae TaxID=2064768 RepID=UPI0011B03C97|nr:hypothetical protein [Pradoshia eiseniae]
METAKLLSFSYDISNNAYNKRPTARPGDHPLSFLFNKSVINPSFEHTRFSSLIQPAFPGAMKPSGQKKEDKCSY